MTLNYVKIVKMYHLFRNSVRHGDAVMVMEVIYRDILPIFHACGKHHYFEIVLSMSIDHQVRFGVSESF